MKIYPSFHNIEETDRIEIKDIPLSYLSIDSVEEEIEIIKEPIVSVEEYSSKVVPYQEFNLFDPYLFDEDGKRIETAGLMQRVGEKYFYVPQDIVEFSPLRFHFDILIKKKMNYVSNEYYDLKVACVDEEGSLVKRLMTIFGDAPRRGLCPLNISINNKDIAQESLTNSSFKDNDFVFIESENGTHYMSGEEIDFSSILSSNTNVWLSVENFEEVMDQQDNDNFKLKSPILYQSIQHKIDGYTTYFKLEEENSNFPKSVYEYQSIFEGNAPCLILEKSRNGYLIISDKKLLEDPGQNVKIIYEILMNVYLKSYIKSSSKNIWITDEIVEHIALRENRHDLKHEKITIKDLINKNDSDYFILEITTSNNEVVFQGMKNDGTILFVKSGANKDPEKKIDQFSIYTTRETIIHYSETNTRTIESNLMIQTVYSETGNYIEILPFKSSSLRIETMIKIILEIPKGYSDFIISCKDNVFKINPVIIYNEEDHGLKVASLKVIKNTVAKNYDMRVLGGGLPEEGYHDNFDLLDIGHINGRSYRLGGAMIITLPKRLEIHKLIIEEVVKKHCTSGDYPVILFE